MAKDSGFIECCYMKSETVNSESVKEEVCFFFSRRKIKLRFYMEAFLCGAGFSGCLVGAQPAQLFSLLSLGGATGVSPRCLAEAFLLVTLWRGNKQVKGFSSNSQWADLEKKGGAAKVGIREGSAARCCKGPC